MSKLNKQGKTKYTDIVLALSGTATDYKHAKKWVKKHPYIRHSTIKRLSVAATLQREHQETIWEVSDSPSPRGINVLDNSIRSRFIPVAVDSELFILFTLVIASSSSLSAEYNTVSAMYPYVTINPSTGGICLSVPELSDDAVEQFTRVLKVRIQSAGNDNDKWVVDYLNGNASISLHGALEYTCSMKREPPSRNIEVNTDDN